MLHDNTIDTPGLFPHFIANTTTPWGNLRKTLSLLLPLCLFEDSSEHSSVFNKNEKENCEKGQPSFFLKYIVASSKEEMLRATDTEPLGNEQGHSLAIKEAYLPPYAE